MLPHFYSMNILHMIKWIWVFPLSNWNSVYLIIRNGLIQLFSLLLRLSTMQLSMLLIKFCWWIQEQLLISASSISWMPLMPMKKQKNNSITISSEAVRTYPVKYLWIPWFNWCLRWWISLLKLKNKIKEKILYCLHYRRSDRLLEMLQHKVVSR